MRRGSGWWLATGAERRLPGDMGPPRGPWQAGLRSRGQGPETRGLHAPAVPPSPSTVLHCLEGVGVPLLTQGFCTLGCL